jgi:hypothetical protein
LAKKAITATDAAAQEVLPASQEPSGLWIRAR